MVWLNAVITCYPADSLCSNLAEVRYSRYIMWSDILSRQHVVFILFFSPHNIMTQLQPQWQHGYCCIKYLISLLTFKLNCMLDMFICNFKTHLDDLTSQTVALHKRGCLQGLLQHFCKHWKLVRSQHNTVHLC